MPPDPAASVAAAAVVRCDGNGGDGGVASPTATASTLPAQALPAVATSAAAASTAPALFIKKRPPDSVREGSKKRQVGVKEGAMVVRDPVLGAMVLWHLPFDTITWPHDAWENNEFWENHWRTHEIKRKWWHGDERARGVLRHGNWGNKEKGEEEDEEWEGTNEEARAHVASLMDQWEEGEGEGEGDEDTVSWEVCYSQKRWGDKEKGED